jgi:hypothetical protein
MGKVSGIEIQGLIELRKAFENVPKEVEASVIRNIARKPANKIVALARKKFKFKKSGITKRSFGVLRVKDRKQKFLEVGIKGRSLAWIFMQGASNRKKKSTGAKTGDIKPLGNLIQEAAGSLGSSITREMSVDLTKTIAKAIKKYAR